MHPDLPLEVTHRVRDTCLCLHLQRAARALARRFDAILAPAGLTNGQFSVLMALNRPEPPPLGAVARLLAMDRTTLTACLKPLERRGLVAAMPDPADRRSRRLALTAEGQAALIRAVPLWEAGIAQAQAALGTLSPQATIGALAALARDPAP